jgi:hypothetical protein
MISAKGLWHDSEAKEAQVLPRVCCIGRTCLLWSNLRCRKILRGRICLIGMVRLRYDWERKMEMEALLC